MVFVKLLYLRNFNEKLITLNFPKYIPDTIVTSNKKDIENFKKKHQKIILKPLNLMGGRSIYYIEDLDKNFNVIFEDMTDMGRNYIMAQKFLEEVAEGDKRIIIINGNVIEHSIIRKSSESDHRSNIASGGYIEKYTLNSNEKKICGEVGNYLSSNNILIDQIHIFQLYQQDLIYFLLILTFFFHQTKSNHVQRHVLEVLYLQQVKKLANKLHEI